MRSYCTYFNARYLARALVLFESMEAHCGEFQLWALCLDVASYEYLVAHPRKGLLPVRQAEFEQGDHRLQGAKADRTLVEYFFTITASWILYVINRLPADGVLTYLDADFFFFSSPEPVFREMEAASIALVSHRFAPELQRYEVWGKFNVGWLTFRNVEESIRCLTRWREQCIDWCHARLENGKYADQKYLDEWPSLYPNLRVVQHPGVAGGPWCLAGMRFSMEAGLLQVNAQPMIAFHFHALTVLRSWLIEYDYAKYNVTLRADQRTLLLQPYLCLLVRKEQELAAGNSPFVAGPKASGRAVLRNLLHRTCFFRFGQVLIPTAFPKLSLAIRALRGDLRKNKTPSVLLQEPKSAA